MGKGRNRKREGKKGRRRVLGLKREGRARGDGGGGGEVQKCGQIMRGGSPQAIADFVRDEW
jgi:hypothetical protein